MNTNRKGQAALEFLTTYAWAFLVILITVGALYYFGVFDFAKFLPQRCLFTSQFECIDFSFVKDPSLSTGEIRLRLNNNIGETINMVSFEVTNDAVDPLSCSFLPLPISDWQQGIEQDIVFSGCSNGVFITGERTEAKITMKYCSPATSGCPKHTVNGKITAIVNEP